MRRTPIRKRRSKPRPGRLKGEAMGKLRHFVFVRDGGRCVVCGVALIEFPPSIFHKLAYHMAHLVSRARGGKDEPGNCVAKCSTCHLVKEHQYGPSLEKPCPKKEVA